MDYDSVPYLSGLYSTVLFILLLDVHFVVCPSAIHAIDCSRLMLITSGLTILAYGVSLIWLRLKRR